jgi:hypothetical protein
MVTTVKVFNSEKSAKGFAERVKGSITTTKQGKFKVRYQYKGNQKGRLPHEASDFGYPNEYWQ